MHCKNASPGIWHSRATARMQTMFSLAWQANGMLESFVSGFQWAEGSLVVFFFVLGEVKAMQWVGPEYSKHEENWDSTDSNLLYLHGLVSCQAAWAGDKKRSLRRCMVSFTWLCKWFAQSDEPTHAAPQLSMLFHTFHASSSSKSWCQWEPPHDIGKMRVPQWRVNGISIWKKSCIVMQQSRCHQHKHIRKSGLVRNWSHCWSQSGSCVLENFPRFSRSPQSLSPPNGWPQRRKRLACAIWGRFLVKHTRDSCTKVKIVWSA